MAHKNDNAASTATLTLDPMSLRAIPERTSEDLSIFSAPALEVVSQWWLESKRRWAELNGTDAGSTVVPRDSQ